jgi:hypothetical protein
MGHPLARLAGTIDSRFLEERFGAVYSDKPGQPPLAQIGANLAGIVADRGYRGHNAPANHKMKVYISGLKRGVTDNIKRDLRRRSAVEPVIDHAQGEPKLDASKNLAADSDEAARLKRDDCAQGFLDDAAPL